MTSEWLLCQHPRDGKVLFSFRRRNSCEDYLFVLRILLDRMGGTLVKEFNGPYGSTAVVSLRGVMLTLQNDSGGNDYYSNDPNQEAVGPIMKELELRLNAKL
jgi:hypothetical protein